MEREELIVALKKAITYIQTAYYDEESVEELKAVVRRAEQKPAAFVEIPYMGTVGIQEVEQ